MNIENKFIMPSSGTFLMISPNIFNIFQRKEIEMSYKKNIKLINSKLDKIINNLEEKEQEQRKSFFINDLELLKLKFNKKFKGIIEDDICI